MGFYLNKLFLFLQNFIAQTSILTMIDMKDVLKRMFKLTLADPTLTPTQRMLMEVENTRQLEKYRSKYGSRTGIYGAFLCTFVFGIYGYTIFTMSRDDFLGEIGNEVQKDACACSCLMRHSQQMLSVI